MIGDVKLEGKKQRKKDDHFYRSAGPLKINVLRF
jgi:hypothetical protein